MVTWLIILAVLAVIYRVSLWYAPTWPCGRCGGQGAHNDFLRPKAGGRCPRCEGRGRKTRLGVRVLMPGTAKAISSGQHGRNY